MTIILARSRVQFSSLQKPQMVSFTRIYCPACCNRQQINQNTANSSQRSKRHSKFHQSCSRCHVGFRDMGTSGPSGIHFLSRCSEILFKVNWLVLSNFKQVQGITVNYHIISKHSSYSYTRIFTIVKCTADRNLIAYRSSWRRALRSHFHPS